jgi:hypothetical protein
MTKIASEHGHLIVDLPILKWRCSIAMLVYQRVGIQWVNNHDDENNEGMNDDVARGSHTWLAGKSPNKMEVYSYAKLSMNYTFSIATFDYRRANMNHGNPTTCPNFVKPKFLKVNKTYQNIPITMYNNITEHTLAGQWGFQVI